MVVVLDVCCFRLSLFEMVVVSGCRCLGWSLFGMVVVPGCRRFWVVVVSGLLSFSPRGSAEFILSKRG